MLQTFLNQSSVFIITEIVTSIIVCTLLYLVVSLHRNHQKYAHLPGPALDRYVYLHYLCENTHKPGFKKPCDIYCVFTVSSFILPSI